MAKVKTPTQPKVKPAEPIEVVVNYDLFDLPTAFHKAGLAGVVLLIESLKARQLLKSNEVNCDLTPASVTITFTEPLVQQLMDDMYDARFVEVAVKSKWPSAEIVRPPTLAEEEAGTKFIYKVVQPKGQFLRDNYPDEEGLWLKLWRDMLWSIPRGRPTTREPFNQRAAGQGCKEGSSVWCDLLKVHKARAKNGFHIEALSSALFPGAQAVNAEGVPFEGRAEQNLLLHFWPLTVLLFVPQRVETDGTTGFSGFTLAVPEVGNLAEFVRDYPSLLSRLNDGLTPDHTARAYRPARAVIDLPAEGALAFLDHLAQVTGQAVEQGGLRYSIGAVEYIHIVKEGNNSKAVASGRVSPIPKLLTGYRAIVEPKDESTRYHNPLFRRALLVALLNDEPWYQPLSRTMATFGAPLFIRQPRSSAENGESPKGPPQFANDAAKKLRAESNAYMSSVERYDSMREPDRTAIPRPQTPLSVIINRVVRSYLLSRTADKTGTNLDTFKTPDADIDWTKVPREFNDGKQKLAQSLFFEFRSRKEQAFVDHFAATFFSVTQRFSEVDRLELADVLTKPDRRDDLKTLTLLALSANS